MSRFISAAALLSIFLNAIIASAEFANPAEVPVDRLIKNISAHLEKNPKDAQAAYLLGRVHYLAFYRQSKTVGAYEHDKLPSFPDWYNLQPMPQKAGKEDIDQKLDVRAMLTHLSEAQSSFNQALQLEPKNPLFLLGKGSLYRTAYKFPFDLPPLREIGNQEFDAAKNPQPDPKDQPKIKLAYANSALDLLKQAHDLTVDADIKKQTLGVYGLQALVSHEAAVASLEILKTFDKLTDEQKAIQQTYRQTIEKLQKKPRGAITPIIFSLTQNKPLADLLDSTVHVQFDLDATGRNFTYPWLQPDTAILVYDPRHTGKITSGFQLFGNRTFDMFFPTGYHALAMLDDNHDGQIAGDELKGLSIWQDRNQNGISDPGEVTPITSTTINSISTQCPDRDQNSPANLTGLQLHNGKTLPTYDYTTPSKGDTTLYLPRPLLPTP